MNVYSVRGPIEGKIDDYYIMENGEEMTFFDTSAQAEICAWALNGIAGGGTLEVRTPVGTHGERGDGIVPPNTIVYEIETYTGPTEGIAP